MAGITLSESAFKKTKDTVLRYQSTPTKSRALPSRRIGDATGGGDITQVEDHQYKAKLKTGSGGEQLVSIEGGSIFVEEGESTTVIKSNSADISSYTENATIYVYAKIPTNWRDVDGDFNWYPTLTPKTGLEITDTNFYSNVTKFPVDNINFSYVPVCTVDVVFTNDIPSYTLTQIGFTEKVIKEYVIEPFAPAVIPADSTDGDEPQSNFVFLRWGNADLPDNSVQLEQFKHELQIGVKQSYQLNVSATQAPNGGWHNYTAVIENSVEGQINTSLNQYYDLLKVNEEGHISTGKSFYGSFRSDGGVY